MAVAKFKKTAKRQVYSKTAPGIISIMPDPIVLENQSGATFGNDAQSYVGQIAIDQAGAAAYILVSDSNGTMTWISMDTSASETPANLTVSNGATFSYLSRGVMQTDTNGIITSSRGTNGQLLIGKTGDLSPVWANLTAGDGIVITNGSGTITITAPDGAMVWESIALSQIAVSNHAYRITAGGVTVTLPTNPTIGDTVVVAQDVAAGTVITVVPQAADTITRQGETLVAGTGLKTVEKVPGGSGGSPASAGQSGCTATFVANDANDWIVQSEVCTWDTTA